jgi:DNA-directed RNA polymerase specialized sigma24 family protein
VTPPVERVYNYLPLARRMDGELAMDVLHNAAVYMLEHPDKLRGAFTAWCFWTVRNQQGGFLDHERRYVDLSRAGRRYSSEDLYDGRAEWVRRQTARLSPLRARVIVLLLSGKDDGEIRTLLRISEKALMNLKHRAIAELRVRARKLRLTP